MKGRVFTSILLVLALMLAVPGCASGPEDESPAVEAEAEVETEAEEPREPMTLDVAYGPGPVAFPLAKIAQDGLADINATVVPQPWTTADQLKALITAQQVEIAVTPLTNAMLLYNNGAKVRLINVGVWGMLYVVTPDASLTELAQLRGKEVAIAGKGGIHDLLFRHLLIGEGIDPDTDLTITYMDLPDMQTRLAMGELTYAVLNEPASSGAVLTAKKEGVTLNRAIDLQVEWAEAVGNPDARIPWAGYVVIGDAEIDTEMIEAFLTGYAEAAEWTNANPAEAGPIIEAMDEKMKAPAVADSLKYARLDPKRAIDSREAIEAFYTELLKTANPESIGGKLPDDGFYYQP